MEKYFPFPSPEKPSSAWTTPPITIEFPAASGGLSCAGRIRSPGNPSSTAVNGWKPGYWSWPECFPSMSVPMQHVQLILPTNSGRLPKRLFVLKRHRAEVTIGAVSAGSIVIHFDVLEDSLSQHGPAGKSLTVDGFHLEGMEEAFCAGIVIAVACVAAMRIGWQGADRAA